MPSPQPLPQLTGHRLFITDGGLETTVMFEHGIDLPCFAAFPLLEDFGGRTLLRRYFEPFVALAAARGTGLIVDTATWRASPDWGSALGYSAARLDAINRDAVALAEEVRETAEARGVPTVVSGAIGPRGDGYVPGARMTPREAEAYHAVQIASFAQTSADMVCALTLTTADEAVGIVRAAQAEGLPVAVSFTVETDGRLPDGTALGDAVEAVDAATDAGAAYFMVNCAHPEHIEPALVGGGAWLDRIAGLRANASRLSHAELDEAEELDAGDPEDLGAWYHDLRGHLRAVTVVGGCCGTDHRHVAAICQAWPV
jgi:homocysteine S-methyltransferase